MISEWTFYMAAVPAVILMGLAKGGFAGLSLISIPLMALVVSPVQAAAIILPVLIVQDAVTLTAYRGRFHAPSLKALVPGCLAGVLLAWTFASRLSDDAIRLFVGLIAAGFVLFTLWRNRGGLTPQAGARLIPGLFWGMVGGVTSFISHAGGPPFQVYMLPQRLPPAIYAGTSGIFFAAPNLFKVGPYISLGQFSPENLQTSAVLFPLAIASNLAGVWLVRRVATKTFYRVVIALTFVVGLKLIWDGARALFP